MAKVSEQYLDPAILARVDNYMLIARWVVDGFVAGLHRSLYQGFGVEFWQYRHYTKGDDLKLVDWKVYARRDELRIKVFQEETSANCTVVLDTSASMGYSGSRSGISKLEYGKIAAACLSYMVARQGDNVGFFAYGDRLESALPPGHRSGQLPRINAELTRLKPGGQCSHEKLMSFLADSISRRGIIVWISDFLDADPALFKAIRHFRYARHDVILLHVLDPDELTFDFRSSTRFVDSESGDEIVTAPEVVRESYLEAFQQYLDEIETVCRKNEVDYQRIDTSTPMADVLAAYLHRREQFNR